MLNERNKRKLKKKRPNIIVFCSALVVFGALTYVSFLGAFSYDDGHRGTLDIVLYYIFLVMRFPTHPLLWSFISKDSVVVIAYPVGLLVNVFFYAFVSERIFNLILKGKRAKAT
jgi:hypothetical protein